MTDDLRSGEPMALLKLPARIMLLATNVFIFIGLFSLSPALPQVRAAFADYPGIDLAIQLIGAGSGFAFAIASFAADRAVDRWGYRKLLVWSLLIFSAAGIAGVLAHSLPLLLLSRVIVGIASAGIVNAALVATGRLVPRSDQAKFLGLQVMIGSVVAVGLYPVVAGLAGIDWRLAFALHLLPALIAPVALSLKEIAGVTFTRDPMVKAARLPLLVLCAASFMGMVIFIISVFGPLYLSANGVRSATKLAMPVTASAIGSIAGSSLFVALGNRLSLKGSLILAFGLVAIGLVVAGATVAVLPFTAGILIASIASGMFTPALNALAISLSPENPGKTLGFATGILYGSMILFPVAAGPLTAVMGSLGAVILGFAGGALTFALLFALRRRRTS